MSLVVDVWFRFRFYVTRFSVFWFTFWFVFATVLLFFSLYPWKMETIVRGNGPHCVIMLHGVGGSPREFSNLIPLFDQTNYTVVVPHDNTNLVSGLSHSADIIVQEIERKIDWNRTEKLSILGNSLGGLVAKMVAVRMRGVQKRVQLKSFVTTVTPHCGILCDVSALGIVRLAISFLMYKTGEDLRRNPMSATEERYASDAAIMKYERRVSYALTTLDLNVPYCSATMGRKITVENPDIIETRSVVLEESGVKWDIVTLPIYSLLNHGNVVGKHMNSFWITWNWESVRKSVSHIRSQF